MTAAVRSPRPPAAAKLLERRGWRPGERWLVVHADDLGLCEATVEAYDRLTRRGLELSGSLMPPAPGFEAIASWCRRHPQADVGVHLTLTSEHPARRWGPVAPAAAASGLVDRRGWLPRRREPLAEADTAAVASEIAAQVESTRAAGVSPTHLDLHMGCLAMPRLLPLYFELARAERLPALVWEPHDWALWDFPPAAARQAAAAIARWAAAGWPVFDRVEGLPLGDPSGRRDRLERALERLPPGLSMLYLHPAVDDGELRRTAADWAGRVADYELLRSGAVHRRLEGAGIRQVGFRELTRDGLA